MAHGLLLTNLGTPNSTNVTDIRRYLCEFLTDKRVIDIPAFIRYLLVYGLIIPFRAKKSANAYQLIWTKQGSPLLLNSQSLVDQLQKHVGTKYKIALGMRYGEPSLTQALHELKECESITILPLYPQYASSSTGSTLEEVMRILSKREVIPSVSMIRDFYQHPSYITTQAEIIKPHLHHDDHLLFSYHGIPERQIQKSGCNIVCVNNCPPISATNQGCYKAQCYQTSRLIAAELELNPDQYLTSFQSRLGKNPWIKPYTDQILTDLAAKGIKNLAIACPSFVADCLETLEEIGIRIREQWIKLGGERFTLIPSLNDNPHWIKAILYISNL